MSGEQSYNCVVISVLHVLGNIPNIKEEVEWGIKQVYSMQWYHHHQPTHSLLAVASAVHTWFNWTLHWLVMSWQDKVCLMSDSTNLDIWIVPHCSSGWHLKNVMTAVHVAVVLFILMQDFSLSSLFPWKISQIVYCRHQVSQDITYLECCLRHTITETESQTVWMWNVTHSVLICWSNQKHSDPFLHIHTYTYTMHTVWESSFIQKRG